MGIKKQTGKKKDAKPGAAEGQKRSKGKRERKDRVLQARVSEPMYEDLVEQARRLRVPVSNLIRNILEDSIRMVGNIVDSSLDIADALRKGADEEELASVIGWQPMTANRRLPCARCEQAIEKGSEAFTSVTAPGQRTLVICGKCKDEIQEP